MPSGVYKHLKHKPNCQCACCKNKRGEKRTHRDDCRCCSCKNKRGEYKGENSPNYGKTGKHWRLSKETIKKMMGHIVTEETIQKIREGNTGKCLSEETIQKIREANIGKKLSKETIKKMSEARKGENNPSWKGGIGNFPYPFNFNNELKELIRKRDNYTCQLCGRIEEQEGEKLSVHHIDYIKENLDPTNLLTLCRGCNAKVNFNREYWIMFFIGGRECG